MKSAKRSICSVSKHYILDPSLPTALEVDSFEKAIDAVLDEHRKMMIYIILHSFFEHPKLNNSFLLIGTINCFLA
jgi:hypothetical protein